MNEKEPDYNQWEDWVLNSAIAHFYEYDEPRKDRDLDHYQWLLEKCNCQVQVLASRWERYASEAIR